MRSNQRHVMQAQMVVQFDASMSMNGPANDEAQLGASYALDKWPRGLALCKAPAYAWIY